MILLFFCVAAICFFSFRTYGTDEGLNSFESQLIDEINKIRKDPQSYIPLLEKFKLSFQGKTIILQGNIHIQSREGTAVVDEAIEYLRTVKAASALGTARCLVSSAEDLHNDQKTTGKIGHKGSDGSSPSQRIKNRCGVKKKTGESLAYGMYAGDTPAAVIMQLVVDDGVKDRMHRIRLFDPGFKFTGVACGDHPKFGFMCVINSSGE